MSYGETDLEPEEAATQSARVANNADDHRARFQILRDRIEELNAGKPWGTDEGGQEFEAGYLPNIDPVFDFAIGNAENTVNLATNAGVGALLSQAEDEYAADQIESAVDWVDETMGEFQAMADDLGGDPAQLLTNPGAAPAVLNLNQLAQDSGVAEELGEDRVNDINDFVDGFFGPSE